MAPLGGGGRASSLTPIAQSKKSFRSLYSSTAIGGAGGGAGNSASPAFCAAVGSKVAEAWLKAPRCKIYDFSFRDASVLDELSLQSSNGAGTNGLAPANSDARPSHYQSGGAGNRGNSERVAVTADQASATVPIAVRLCNNRLESLTGLSGSLTRLGVPGFEGSYLQQQRLCPFTLRWLDLSFNRFSTVDAALAECVGLTHLYLHANQISELAEIDVKLARMPFASNLVALTLHGNPVTAVPECKLYAMLACPRLRHLDFSGLTRADRRSALHLAARLHRPTSITLRLPSPGRRYRKRRAEKTGAHAHCCPGVLENSGDKRNAKNIASDLSSSESDSTTIAKAAAAALGLTSQSPNQR